MTGIIPKEQSGDIPRDHDVDRDALESDMNECIALGLTPESCSKSYCVAKGWHSQIENGL